MTKTLTGDGVPRGVEVLIKKAAVDAAFRDVLLDERAGAAARLELALEPAEEAMLAAIPRAQLDQVIARTTVSAALRPAFLTYAAAVMLAALGATSSVFAGEENDEIRNISLGIVPDEPAVLTGYDGIELEEGEGMLLGFVFDEEGAGVAGAEVTIFGTDFAAKTNENGGYQLGPIQEGYYTIRVTCPGYINYYDLATFRPNNLATVVVILKKGGEPEAPLPPHEVIMEVTELTTEVTGDDARWRTRDAVLEIIQRHLGGINNAYRLALGERPDIEGTIVLNARVSAEGELISGGVMEDPANLRVLTGIISSRVRSWRFPPVGNGNTYFTLTFEFVLK